MSPAQNNTTGTLEGVVKDSLDNPLNAVNVTINKLQKGAVTDSEGKFEIEDIPAGTYHVQFSKLGYAAQTREVNISAGGWENLTIQLREKDLNLESVTVTGSPVPKDILKTTADVDLLIGKDKLEQQQASMGETVDKMAGINTVNTGPHSGKPVIRGLSGNRIRMLHNGIALDHQQYGVRHMPNMDPFLADRIEVVQGPSSVLYGSDAMGGVVNFITPEIPNARGKNGFLKGNALGEFRTNNNQWTSGLGLKGAKGSWGFAGAVVRRSAGNMTTPNVTTFDDPDGEAGDPRFSGELDHTDFDQLNGTFSTGYSGDFGEVSVNYTRWNNEHNFLLPDGEGLGQRLQNDILQGKGAFNLGKDNTLVTKLTYTRDSRQSNPATETRGQLPKANERAHLDILREIYSGRTVLQHQSIGPVKGQIGVELRQTDQTTRGINEPLVPSADIFNAGAFMYEEAEFGNLSLTAGARFDYLSQEAQPNAALNLPDSNESSDILTNNYQVFSSSLGANYSITENLAVKVNVGRGFRAPSIFDLHVEGIHGGVAAYQVGDPELKPEVNLNTDLSVKWRSNRFKVKATVYRNVIDNYIFLVNTGEQSQEGPPILRTVQGDAELLGGYVSAEARLLPWLKVSSSYEAVQGKSVGNNAPQNVDELPLLPANKARGQVTFMQNQIGPLNRPYLRIGVRHSAAKDAAGRYEPFWQFDDAFQFGRASTSAYTLLDASIGFEIPWQNDAISVSIQGQNLTNKAYRDFLDTYKGYALSPGRNVTFKLNVPFAVIGG